MKKWTRRMAIIGGVAGGGLLGVGFWFSRERDRLGERTLFNVKPNEAGLSGYQFVSITGDAKCPSILGGTVSLNEGESITCTITNDDVGDSEEDGECRIEVVSETGDDGVGNGTGEGARRWSGRAPVQRDGPFDVPTDGVH